MYRYSNDMNEGSLSPKVQKRILLGTILVLLVALIGMSIIGVSAMSFRSNTREQLDARMSNNMTSALEQANVLSNTVSSMTASRIALIRQYVYAMEEINKLSVRLYGEAEGRYAPDEAFSVLTQVLDTYEGLTQTATASTLEQRTILITNLSNLRTVIMAK